MSVELELFIAPDREILDCKALHRKPADAPVDGLCERFMGRKMESSAIGPGGEPVHAVASYVFNVTNGSGYQPPPDRRIEVADVPGRSKTEQVRLALFVDANGSTIECQAISDRAQALADLACPQLIGTDRGRRQGRNGEPVPYYDGAYVELVERQPAVQ